MPMHVGQSEVATGISIRELLMIEAEQLQHRRVQVVDMDDIFDGLESEFIGGRDRLSLRRLPSTL
jgi:hypothetical protein